MSFLLKNSLWKATNNSIEQLNLKIIIGILDACSISYFISSQIPSITLSSSRIESLYLTAISTKLMAATALQLICVSPPFLGFSLVREPVYLIKLRFLITLFYYINLIWIKTFLKFSEICENVFLNI